MGLPRSRLRSLQVADQIGFHSARGVQRAGVDRVHVVAEDPVGRLLSVFAQEIIAELYTSYKTCRTLLPSNGLPRTCAKSERKFDTNSNKTKCRFFCRQISLDDKMSRAHVVQVDLHRKRAKNPTYFRHPKYCGG
jgi:hypothetical protein